MTKYFTIQEIATLTNLSAHTLRYYERIGLLRVITRSGSGHRRYSLDDKTWLEFLIRLRATGMSIRNMQQFAKLRHQGDQTAGERKIMLQAHLDFILKSIAELSNCKRVLLRKIEHYKKLESSIKKT